MIFRRTLLIFFIAAWMRFHADAIIPNLEKEKNLATRGIYSNALPPISPFITLSKPEQETLCSIAFAMQQWQCVLNNNQTSPWSDPCGWLGITCSEDGSHIKRLSFPGMNIPIQFPNLTAMVLLEDLSIIYRDFVGSLQADLLPTSLTSLTLINTRLSGSLPSFASFTNLHTMTILSNKLSGQIVADQFPSSLQTLILSSNIFTGSLPTFAHLVQLQQLELSNNQFTGSLFTNQLPSSLRILMLDQNHLTGSLPALSILTNLRDIYLSRNHFHGSLPDGHLPTSLRSIFLNENEFIGLVPSFLDFHELQKIDLSKNIFSGTLRLNIFPSNIQSIDLSENILSGSLPSLRNLLQLSELSISDNTFSGSLTSNHFPSAIASVYLNENKFSGHLPNFQEYELLTTLDLSMNSFSGTIPSFLNVSSLISLSISNNHFTGVLSGTQFPLSLLILDVHSNELSDITSSICDLYLQNAYLLNNSFTCYPSCFAPHQEDYSDSLPRCIDTTDEILCKLSLDWKMPDIIRRSIGPMDPIQLSMKYTGTFTNLRTIDVNATYYEIWFDPSSDANLGVSICLDVQCLSVIARYGGTALRNSWPGVGDVNPLIVKNSTFYFVYYGNSVDITGVRVTVIPYRPYRTGWECKDRINRTSSSVVAPAISASLEAVNYCSWSGIKCLGGSKGAVTAINLNAFGIIGNNHVKEILAAFPRLIRLNLGSNAIKGGVDFVPHTRLRVLDLSFNTLNGTIPCSVNQLQRLEILSLKQNQFDGTVPGCIADTNNRKSSAAVTFDLAYNKFFGQVDAGLCSLTPASTKIILKNNPLIACYAGGECTVELDNSVESCAPTFMPTASPAAPVQSVGPEIVVGVVVAFLAILVSIAFLIKRRYAKIASEGLLARYDGLPLHKAVVQRIELTMKDIETHTETIVNCADDEKSLLKLIMEGRPGYSISSEVFMFIVKALLFQGVPQEFRLHWATLIQSEDDLVMDTIHQILEDHSGTVEEFVYGKADSGRAFVEMASYRVSKLMMRHTYLHKQFELNESYEYRSKACEVILAEYHPLADEDSRRFKEKNAISMELKEISQQGTSSKSKKNIRSVNAQVVALKFMKSQESFLNERSILTELSDVMHGTRYEDYFLQLFHSYNGSDENDDEDARSFRRNAIHKHYEEYPYCLVLEAAKTNLETFLSFSDIFSSDWEEIERILTHVLSAVGFLHSRNIVHGDIKPTNIMITFDGHYKLIDLDSASQIGKAIGKRVSTAYCPPEMIIDKPTPRPKIVHLRGGSTSTDEYQYLLADPSYDVWSCGILLYYLASGGLPFAINNFDCISSEEDLLGLFHWTEQYKSQKIHSVVNNLHNFSQQQQDKRPTKDILVQVHNLLTLLLQKDPSKRPSVLQALQHPFFTKKVQPRMAGHEATYDVFISYRVASDSKHAARLYRELTEVHGLRVWLDKYCLEAGKNWERGFCEGLIKSSAFVCLISRDGMFHSEHPNQNFVKLNPESSACDNCLLEWRLALEMQERGMLTAIFPLFIGKELPGQAVSLSVPVLNIYEAQTHEQIDIEKGPVSVLSVSPSVQYGNFFEQSKNYPYNPAALPLQPIDSVEKKINELLDHFGYVASYLSAQGASACSVKNVWTRIVSNQGAFIEGEYEAAIERVSQAISEMVKHQH